MPTKRKPNSSVTKLSWLLVFGLCGVVAILAAVVMRVARKKPNPPAIVQNNVATTQQTGAAVFATYGKSPSCKGCHEEQFQLWQNSHHALAERPVEFAQDSHAFLPPRQIRHGSQTSETLSSDNRLNLITAGLDGTRRAYSVERVLGVDPLRQFLVPASNGRFQVSELAYDPARSNWFDVYGEEDRRPGEWGHWTGRGMTWNSMCAACHNTRVRKNYQENTDSYATSFAEMSVGCEACHGPMADHNRWQAEHPNHSGDPTARHLSREQMFAVCGSCHSRRAELTGDFRPGDAFFDHYALSIPDDTDLFYADGQIREEDYEFNAFHGSAMHAAGVRCLDCHEPHSGKARVAGNNLCMVCHFTPAPPAPKIDAATHSHHKAGERGDQCVDCHMPQTVYMQRHARHDHGFTVPDPLLTKELNIPNACNRCHSDRTADWSLAALEKWYGPARERPARARARAVAQARAGDNRAIPELLHSVGTQTNTYWRAVAANLLRHWIAEPRVMQALLSSAGNADPLVRAMSARALEPLAGTANQSVRMLLQNLLNDPIRAVRIDAAWALHATLDTNSPAASDLMNYLTHSADQPAGALQLGIFHLDRGNLSLATSYLQRAVNWDTNSAPPRHALAVALSMQGRSEEALQQLQAACRLAPREAEYRFKLGLALNELGKTQEARAALEQAVKLDPQFVRAWYNLGLAFSATGNPDSALESLVRAESLDAHAPEIPYARATILARLGRREDAQAAARRALEIDPRYADAAELLRSLSR